jgi:hypothetical protein
VEEAVEVIGEILEDDVPVHEASEEDQAEEQQKPRKFYAPDSSSDEELEVF